MDSTMIESFTYMNNGAKELLLSKLLLYQLFGVDCIDGLEHKEF